MELYNNICIFARFFNVSYIFMSEFIKHNLNIFIYKCSNIFNNRVFSDFPVRLDLIKNIVIKLEDLNIVYVKVFQSLCINKHILSDSEKDFLIKYTDNVPFKSEHVD